MDQIKIIDDLATVGQINQERPEIMNKMVREMNEKIEEEDTLVTYCWRKSTEVVYDIVRPIDNFLDGFGNRFEDFVKYSKHVDQEHPELIYEALFDY